MYGNCRATAQRAEFQYLSQIRLGAAQAILWPTGAEVSISDLCSSPARSPRRDTVAVADQGRRPADRRVGHMLSSLRWWRHI